MSIYTANVTWKRGAEEKYTDNRYSRAHQWQFDGGATLMASSSPHIVPLPYSVEEHIDPEEAFVALLSSCHMLFFLSIAAKKQFIVDTYSDSAVGFMEKDANGKTSITRVVLKPMVYFSGADTPSISELESIHEQSHTQCFIANSVKTEVFTEIVLPESK